MNSDECGVNEDPLDNVLDQMRKLRLDEALRACVVSRNFYLATVLTAGNTAQVQKQLSAQLELWAEQGVPVPETVGHIYGVLCGDLEIIKRADWKSALGMILAYTLPKNSDICTAVEQFESVCAESPCAPLSAHSERHIDLLYSLIKVAASPASLTELPVMLHPYGHQGLYSLGHSWLVFYSLKQLLHSGAFEVSDYSEIENSFTLLGHLALDFAEELEFEGQWALAVYVLRTCGAEELIRRVLRRNCGEDTAELEEFLISNVGVKAAWIYEAKALYFESKFQFQAAL